MRIVVFGNNWVGWQVVDWLRRQQEELVGLVIHPAAKQRYGPAVIESAGVPASCIFDGSQFHQPAVVNAIKALRADLALSVFFDYLVPPELLRLFPSGGINLHPAYLPWNRGQYPNVWSIVERTPAGVTLHYMDAGIDTGDVIARQRVAIEPVDTGETLYRKLERACLELFKNTWPAIRAGKAPRHPQRGTGTSHRRRDAEQIDEIDLDRMYRARDLIDVIRAKTFPPYPGAYFLDRGRKVYLRLEPAYGKPTRRSNASKRRSAQPVGAA